MIGSSNMDLPLLLYDEYIGSQVLQSLLARFNLVLTRSSDDALYVAPSNVAMASLSASNYLLPTLEVNNILLPMGLHLTRANDGSFDIELLPFVASPQCQSEFRLPGDEPHTKLMDTSIL